ncbi:MAG TPA: hypothetical protein VFA20_19505 [Myxococcaceae bacterium]|nr:hypothetical protein [Myxococcaceae bacterium]
MAGGGGGFRELEAWRYGMELAVRVFDVTAEEEDALRPAALEIPQRIAAGWMDGRPKIWARCVALAQGALDRLEAEARRLWAAPDVRLLELVACARRALDALEAAPMRVLEPAAAVDSVEVEAVAA